MPLAETHKKIRTELVLLKTDLEQIPKAETLESLHRGSVEAVLANMQKCKLSDAMQSYAFVQELQADIIKESVKADMTKAIEPLALRLAGIDRLLKSAVDDIARDSCACNINK